MLILELLLCLIGGAITAGVIAGFVYLCIKHWYIGMSFVTMATLLAMVIFIR